MKDDYLYNIFRENLSLDRYWYKVGVCKQKDDGPIIHAIALKEFTIIPEKDKHILVFYDGVKIPQNRDNYDHNFDEVLSKFLNKIEGYYPEKGCKVFKFKPSLNKNFIIIPYLLLDRQEKFLHLEKFDSFSIQLNKTEYKIIEEFLVILDNGWRLNGSDMLKLEDIFKRKDSERGIDILERKLECRV